MLAVLPSVSQFFIIITIIILLHFCSDVVGFSSLTTRMRPQEIIRIIDHLHALLDEIYGNGDIFIVERQSDGCCAVTGLAENLLEEKGSSDDLSLADSSYGSDNNLLQSGNCTNRKLKSTKDVLTSGLKSASHYASQLASAALNLMSSSSKISVPLVGRKQLQLRIALHSGPCSAGVLGLQSTLRSNRIPQFKIWGPTVRHVYSLCHTGLALQIRVSKQCKDILSCDEKFKFERCPDYQARADRKPVESYWLVRKSDLPLKMPPLDLALPLSDYEDTEI